MPRRRRYTVRGWNHVCYQMRADELHLRVMNDSKESDYNWIASATELMRICRFKDFPEEYADDIKRAVLNCFSNLEGLPECGYKLPTDDDAIEYAYNSLLSNVPENLAVKSKYLAAVISAVESNYFVVPIYSGETYRKFVHQWKKKWFDEYITWSYVCFKRLRVKLDYDLEDEITKLEKSGALKEDEEEFIDLGKSIFLYF